MRRSKAKYLLLEGRISVLEFISGNRSGAIIGDGADIGSYGAGVGVGAGGVREGG